LQQEISLPALFSQELSLLQLLAYLTAETSPGISAPQAVRR
jgi:hypothetical protein